MIPDVAFKIEVEKLFYLAGVTLLGGRVVIRGNFGHVHLP